jgi:hypothetical protein
VAAGAGGALDGLRAQVERLSGFDLSNVRVFENSARPAEVEAHAYTQGNDIHLGPGQEQHLGHELWHVVQQRRGHVRVTTQVGGRGVNDDERLEREADMMGSRARSALAGSVRGPAGGAPLASPFATSERAERLGHALDRVADSSQASATPIQLKRGKKRGKRHRHQPRRNGHSATRRADRASDAPDHLELGAGEGDYSAAFRNQYARRGDRYLATDLAPRAGPTGFLTVAKAQGVASEYGVNALDLPDRFGGRGHKPLKQIVAANPYGGGQANPGVGFGLMKYDEVRRGQRPQRSPDPRFIQHALPRVGERGQLRLLGRSNALYLGLQARGIDDAHLPRRLHGTNPYLNVNSPDDLESLATTTGSHIHVTAAHPPRAVRVGGGAPDTPQRGGLGDYNTQFAITQSTRPGVTYSYDAQRYSSSEQVQPEAPAAAPKAVRHVKPVHQKDRAKALAESSATFRSVPEIPRGRPGGKAGRGTRSLRGGKAGRDLRDAIDIGLEEASGAYEDDYDEDQDDYGEADYDEDEHDYDEGEE